MGKNKIIGVVSDILTEYLDPSEMELYHLEFVKEGPDRILRIYIDKRDGFIGTDDCEAVSRYVSDKLDEADLIEDNYILEVSSPGLDRVLITPEHFKRYIGEVIEVSLYREYDGRKKLEGVLEDYSEGDIVLVVDGQNKLKIESKYIAKANLAVII